jgi:hypothetical protein
LTGAVFVVAFAGGALTAAFLTAAFFRTAFLAAVSCCALAALTVVHRFLVAAMILARPALLILRFGFGGGSVAGADGSDSPRSRSLAARYPRQQRHPQRPYPRKSFVVLSN